MPSVLPEGSRESLGALQGTPGSIGESIGPPQVVSWDQHVPFGGLKWVPQDQNGSLKRPKTGLEEDVVGSSWIMWAFLLAQLLKNWSISFFEKVTLLNLMPSTSPNWGGIPRWPCGNARRMIWFEAVALDAWRC